MLKKKTVKKTGKTICLVIPSLQAGGMERVMSELAEYFSRDPVLNIHLILYGRTRKIFYDLPGNIIIHKPLWPFDNKKRAWSTLKTLYFLRKKIKEIEPDTILSFGEYWNSFVMISLLGLKVPVYISDRCSPAKNLGQFHEMLRKILYPKAAGIIAQTSKAKEYFTDKKLNENIRVISNPIRQILKGDLENTRENIVLSVGRLIDTKHHDRLIDIFQKANPGGWRLVIVGGDAIRQSRMMNLEEKIKKAELGDIVELTGTISNVDDYYLRSKIFALTSSSEGFPNVLGEAMSAGLPVISYDCVAGPKDMINDGENGFLIDLFDDETYVRKLNRLMVDEKLRIEMGSKSSGLVKQFGKETIIKQYAEFIEESS